MTEKTHVRLTNLVFGAISASAILVGALLWLGSAKNTADSAYAAAAEANRKIDKMIDLKPWRAEIMAAMEAHGGSTHEGALSMADVESLTRRILSEASNSQGLYATEGRAKLESIQNRLDRMEAKIDKLVDRVGGG